MTAHTNPLSHISSCLLEETGRDAAGRRCLSRCSASVVVLEYRFCCKARRRSLFAAKQEGTVFLLQGKKAQSFCCKARRRSLFAARQEGTVWSGDGRGKARETGRRHSLKSSSVGHDRPLFPTEGSLATPGVSSLQALSNQCQIAHRSEHIPSRQPCCGRSLSPFTREFSEPLAGNCWP